jgi:hypothetical protein
LPGPGPAPGTTLRQQARAPYGTVTLSPAAQLQRQAVENSAVPGSPYKQLLAAQRAKKRSRRRRKFWRRVRAKLAAFLCWPFAVCRKDCEEDEDVLV